MDERKYAYKVCIICCLLSLQNPVYAGNIVEENGDKLQILIPLIGLASSILSEDNSLKKNQFIRAFISNQISTEVIKHAIKAKRPNGGANSFPSGHTAAAFMGARYIHSLYGWKYSIPAYLSASYVGYSRVYSDNHYIRDVLAGAIIGTMNSAYYTNAYNWNAQLFVGENLVGVKFNF